MYTLLYTDVYTCVYTWISKKKRFTGNSLVYIPVYTPAYASSDWLIGHQFEFWGLLERPPPDDGLVAAFEGHGLHYLETWSH